MVDVSGYFESDGLRPGAWEVGWSASSGSLSEPQVVELTDAVEQELILSFPGTVVRGIVSDTDGLPVHAARVRDLVSGAFAFSAADGTFSLDAEETGILDLQARFEERSSDVVRIELEAGRHPDPVRLVLEDRRKDKLDILVTDADGDPVGGALVFLEEEGKSVRILTADARGRAEALIHPPRPPRVRAAAVAAGLWTFGEWTSLETVEEGLLLQVGESGSLLASTEREEEDLLRILSPTGWDVSWLLTRLGRRPAVSPGRPLRVQGLPPGIYSVAGDSSRSRVEIEAGAVSEVRLE